MATATPATRAAHQAAAPFTLHEYAPDTGAVYGAAAAARLGLDTARVLKSLVVRASDARHAVAVVPVGAQLDLKSDAAVVGAKSAELARPADAQRLTGATLAPVARW